MIVDHGQYHFIRLVYYVFRVCLHEQDHHSDIAYFCLVVHRLRIYHQWSLSYKLSPYHCYYIHGEILVRYFTAQKHKLPAAGERHAEKGGVNVAKSTSGE